MLELEDGLCLLGSVRGSCGTCQTGERRARPVWRWRRRRRLLIIFPLGWRDRSACLTLSHTIKCGCGRETCVFGVLRCARTRHWRRVGAATASATALESTRGSRALLRALVAHSATWLRRHCRGSIAHTLCLPHSRYQPRAQVRAYSQLSARPQQQLQQPIRTNSNFDLRAARCSCEFTAAADRLQLELFFTFPSDCCRSRRRRLSRSRCAALSNDSQPAALRLARIEPTTLCRQQKPAAPPLPDQFTSLPASGGKLPAPTLPFIIPIIIPHWL